MKVFCRISEGKATYTDLKARYGATNLENTILWSAVFDDLGRPALPIKFVAPKTLWIASDVSRDQLVITEEDCLKLSYSIGGFCYFDGDARAACMRLRRLNIRLEDKQIVSTLRKTLYYVLQVTYAPPSSSVSVLSFIGKNSVELEPHNAQVFQTKKQALTWWQHNQESYRGLEVMTTRLKIGV